MDCETELNYYGARYYNPDINIWLSIDPLSDKYPSMSPYMYCAGNPVIFIDPDGRRIDHFFNRQGQFVGSTPTGNKIMITSASNMNDVNSNNSESLSSFLYNSNVSQDVRSSAAKNILNHYSGTVGVTGNVGLGVHKNKYVPAYYNPQSNQVSFNPLYSNYSLFDNIYNVISLLQHEGLHQTDKNPLTFKSHAEIYLQQMLDPVFGNTTDGFQIGTVSSFSNFVMNGIYKNNKGSYDLLNKFNNENKLGYSLVPNYEDKKIISMDIYKNSEKIGRINYKNLDTPN